MPNPLRPSFVHRLLRIQPGSAPEFLKSRDECLGMDLPTALGSAGLFGTMMLFTVLPVLAVALVVVFAPAYFMMVMPFDSAERLARARKRRNECTVCGSRLRSENNSCETCQAR